MACTRLTNGPRAQLTPTTKQTTTRRARRERRANALRWRTAPQNAAENRLDAEQQHSAADADIEHLHT